MSSLNEKSLNYNSEVKINFEGGDLTSDSGILLYGMFNEKLGVSEVIEEMFNTDKTITHRKHNDAEVILQSIYQDICGYNTDDSADELRNDKALKTILKKDVLASQPTISRVNNRATTNSIKQLQTINYKLRDRVYKINMPSEVILDADSTDAIAYGKQQGAKFNGHYRTNGFHPLLIFDCNTQDLIKATLRPGNVYTSRKIVEFTGPVLKDYKIRYPKIKLKFRADSGFATPELYKLCETHKTEYAIRLKSNATLIKKSTELSEELLNDCKDNMIDYAVVYGEFKYKANSWDTERRVVIKIEKPAGQMALVHMFVVTNMESTAEEVIDFYCDRGEMENFIKECKNGFGLCKMSSTSYVANAMKLQRKAIAYNINNWLRRLVLPSVHKSIRIETIRVKLIKVAAKIVKHSRYIHFKLNSTYPYKELFIDTFKNIKSLACLRI